MRPLKTRSDILRETPESRIEAFAVEAAFVYGIKKEPSFTGPG